MTPERWAQIRQIFDGALERTPKDRAAYLRVVCAGDDAMRREVESLLASHADASGFWRSPRPTWASRCTIRARNRANIRRIPRGPYQLRSASDAEGWVRCGWRRLPGNGVKVAVKLVKRGMDTSEILRRFRMERQVLASLNHPNIARLIDGGSTRKACPIWRWNTWKAYPSTSFARRGRAPSRID